jgi:hypothetical protein
MSEWIVTRGGIPVAAADTAAAAQRYALLSEVRALGPDAGTRLHTWRLEEKSRSYRLHMENLKSGRFNRTWWTVRRVPRITGHDRP